MTTPLLASPPWADIERIRTEVRELDRRSVLYVLAMYAEPRGHGLPLVDIRNYSGIRGRSLSGALTSLRRRGLAWRGVSGCWRPTEAGREQGRA